MTGPEELVGSADGAADSPSAPPPERGEAQGAAEDGQAGAATPADEPQDDMISRLMKDLESGGYLLLVQRQVVLARDLPARW